MKRFVKNVGITPWATRKNGITLIALIITIIVMLILVGVTINVALNGGVFEKAKTAAAQTEQEKIYEEIIASCVYDNKGEINVLATYNAFKEIEEIAEQKTTPATGLTEENTKSMVFVVKGKTGNYAYSITTGKVIKGEIPFVTDLSSCLIDYDKKYVYDGVTQGAPEGAFIKLGSDGTINQYIDQNNGEEILTFEELINYNPVVTNTSITIGGILIYEIVDSSTMTLTSNDGTFTFKLQ